MSKYSFQFYDSILWVESVHGTAPAYNIQGCKFSLQHGNDKLIN